MYSCETHLAAVGPAIVAEFNGPGILARTIRIPIEGTETTAVHRAEDIARWLTLAYEAGRTAKVQEIRNALGVWASR